MYNIDKSELMHNHGNLQARDGILNTCGGGGWFFTKKQQTIMVIMKNK